MQTKEESQRSIDAVVFWQCLPVSSLNVKRKLWRSFIILKVWFMLYPRSSISKDSCTALIQSEGNVVAFSDQEHNNMLDLQ